jgi:hypothetical protein
MVSAVTKGKGEFENGEGDGDGQNGECGYEGEKREEPEFFQDPLSEQGVRRGRGRGGGRREREREVEKKLIICSG